MSVETRLRQQAKKDYERPWHPGMQLTDAEQLVKIINDLRESLAWAEKQVSDYRWAEDQSSYHRMGM